VPPFPAAARSTIAARAAFSLESEHVRLKLRRYVAWEVRNKSKGDSCNVRPECLGNRDGKVPSRVARCLLLQIDDKVLDH